MCGETGTLPARAGRGAGYALWCGACSPGSAPTAASTEAVVHHRLTAALDELRAIRAALLAAQRRTDATLCEQDVRLTHGEHLLYERLTAVQASVTRPSTTCSVL